MAFSTKKLDAEKLKNGHPVDINGMTFYVKKFGKIERSKYIEDLRAAKEDLEEISKATIECFSSLIVGWRGVTPEKLQPYCVTDEFYDKNKDFPDDDSDDVYTIKRASIEDEAALSNASYFAQLEKAKQDYKDTATDEQIEEIAEEESFKQWSKIVVDTLLVDWDAEFEEGKGKVKLTKAIRNKIKKPEFEPKLDELTKVATDHKLFAKLEIGSEEIEFNEKNLEKYVKTPKGIDRNHNILNIIQGEAAKEDNYLAERLEKDVEEAKK